MGLLVSSILNVAGLVATNYVFTNLKAYVAGNLLLMEGVFALAVGWIIYGEKPVSMEIVGAAIILLCAVAISSIDRSENRAVLPESDLGE